MQMHDIAMTTSTPYASAHWVRESRDRESSMRRHASRVEDVVRAAVLVAALATLAVGLTGVLRSGSEQVASRLDAATHVASAR
jgi:type VI protein secretion system component VasF